MEIILFIIILGILVVSHEFGHFVVAKFFGMRVDEFGFGFPPRLFGKKIGGTVYSINAIPFGGFVKIYGEDGEFGTEDEACLHGSFAKKSLFAQSAVVLAGIVFNLLLAWGLISVGYMIGLPTSVGDTMPGQTVQDAKLVITDVQPGSPAEKAGLMPGDTIVSIKNGARTPEQLLPETVQQFIQSVGADAVTLLYQRGAEPVKTVDLVPAEGIVAGHRAVGIAMDRIGMLKLSFFDAVSRAFVLTYHLAASTIFALFDLVKNIFVGHADLAGVSGPVGIVSLVGSASALGFIYLLSLTAMISINLAVMNLIPFPALDGGRLFFIIVEAIRGKALHPKLTQAINTTGFFLLVFIMAFLTYGDIMKLVRG
jgi:regulator of sigma E protease